MGRLTGKVAIVTGAASGMGTSHARRLAAEGAKVMLTDISDEAGLAVARSIDGHARFLHHDVGSEVEWTQIVKATEDAFGPVSVLVNNAAICSYCPIETLEEAEFRRLFNVNQISVFLGMKTVLPSMRRAGGGSMINISSVSGLIGTPTNLAYTASKFAVRGMTKVAAIEFAPYNIRVNSVHPGIIGNCGMTKLTPENTAVIEIAAAATPASRCGEADEISSMVLMLASDECRFATGAEFVVDGGQTCL